MRGSNMQDDIKSLLTVLLIEDEPSEALLIRKILEDKPSSKLEPSFTVIHHDRLADGLACLAKGGIDVILLDLSLPDGRGFETFTRVHSQAAEVPIIVLTGFEDEILVAKTLKNGAQDYLLKGKDCLIPGLQNTRLLTRPLKYAIERQKMMAEMHALALHDQLTGLYNRRGFEIMTLQQLKLSARTKREMILFLVDIDEMKKINDAYGHPQGDLAIASAAEILKKTFRESDILARIGGDEFAVLALETQSDIDNHSLILKRLSEIQNDVNAQLKTAWKLSLSVGTAQYNSATMAFIEQLIAKADDELYKCKLSKTPH